MFLSDYTGQHRRTERRKRSRSTFDAPETKEADQVGMQPEAAARSSTLVSTASESTAERGAVSPEEQAFNGAAGEGRWISDSAVWGANAFRFVGPTVAHAR